MYGKKGVHDFLVNSALRIGQSPISFFARVFVRVIVPLAVIARYNFVAQYVDWGSRFVGDMNWCSVVGTGLSGPTLSVL
jgi:hypothetical protein